MTIAQLIDDHVCRHCQNMVPEIDNRRLIARVG
jgi:hypothetical protein